MAGIIRSKQGGDPESKERKPKGRMLPDPNAGTTSPGEKDQASTGRQEPAGSEQDESGEQATQEEQDAFKRVELAAIDILYNEKLNPQFVKMLQDGADTPAATLARVAMQIFGKIDKDSNGTIPEAVVIQGAIQSLEVVRDMVEKLGIFEVNDQVLGRAVQEMITLAADRYDIDEEELQELIDEYQGESQQMVSQQSQYAGVR